MSEARAQAAPDAPPDGPAARQGPAADPDAAGDGRATKWSQLWHVPVLIAGVGLFALGTYLAVPGEDRPDYAGVLDSAAQYLKANNLDQAQGELAKIRPHLDSAPTPAKGRYWQYWADLNYEQQRRQSPGTARTPQATQTRQKIRRYYNRARKLGHDLRPTSLQRKAKTLVALGEPARALAIVNEQLSDAPAYRRYSIIRDLIERARAGGSSSEQITKLIDAFKRHLTDERDADRRREQHIWVAGVEADRLLERDRPEAALRRLDPRIMRLKGEAKPEALAPLYLKRARAYRQMGERDQAQRWYQYAQQHLPSASPLNARVLVGLAALSLGPGDEPEAMRRARGLLSQAVTNYPSNDGVYIEALAALGDVEARLNNQSRALELLNRAVQRLGKRGGPSPALRRGLVERVRAHIERANASGRYQFALDLLRALKPLHRGGGELPAGLLLDFATTHEKIARQREAYANGETDSPDAAPGGASDQPLKKARGLAHQEAAIHFGKAGAFYHRHAEQVTVTSNQKHGRSLWAAATNFDKAQRWRDAIAVYSQYIETRPDDPRRLKAINHLGKAFLADGQYKAAAARFERLLESHPKSPQAYASLVPLARAHMGQGNPQKAVEYLRKVVNDHRAIRPGSDTYRRGLIELGKLYYRMGQQEGAKYVDAIETLSEAVTRYGKTDQGPRLRYLLADSYRQSVDALAKQLRGELARRKQLALQKERRRRLKEAQRYYNQVINQLEARPAESRSGLENVYYRNAYFYQADCAFDRGQYQLAIDLYNEAARRWDDNPASLVALVQIVNAHCELGQYQQAGVYNRMALDRLKQMPEGAFDQPGLPMSRQHWEDWLRWTSERDLFSGPARARQAKAARGG